MSNILILKITNKSPLGISSKGKVYRLDQGRHTLRLKNVRTRAAFIALLTLKILCDDKRACVRNFTNLFMQKQRVLCSRNTIYRIIVQMLCERSISFHDSPDPVLGMGVLGSKRKSNLIQR